MSRAGMTSHADSSAPGRMRRALVPGILLGLIALAFGPATDGGFVWDDALLIGNDARLRSADRLGELLTSNLWDTTSEAETASTYYRPVVSLAYFAQFQAFGLHTRGYHCVSVALHMACALLVLGFLRTRLAGRPHGSAYDSAHDRAHDSVGNRTARIAAAFGAALFALHPTRTESVTWISGSSDLWMTLFLLLAVKVTQGPRTWLRDAATVLCAVLALFSKETAIVLPLLLWIDARWLETSPERKQQAFRGAALTAGGMLVALLVRVQLVPLPTRSLNEVLFGISSRVLATLGHYVQAVLWPMHPSGVRGDVWTTPEGHFGTDSATVAAGVAIIVLAIALTMRGGRTGSQQPWLADLAWLVLPLAPVLNILPTQLLSLASDRFLYAPMIGLAALLARWIARAWPALSQRGRATLVSSAAFVTALFMLVIVTYGKAFESEAALWDYELLREPNHAYVLERSVDLAIARGDFKRAIELAQQGEQLAQQTYRSPLRVRFLLALLAAQRNGTPDLEQARLRILRDFFDQLASAGPGELATLDLPALRYGETEVLPRVQFRIALSTAERRVLDASAVRFELGRAALHARTLQIDRAIALLEETVVKRPKLVEGYSELAIMRARKGDFAAAESAVHQGFAVAPAHRAIITAARALSAAKQMTKQMTAQLSGNPVREALVRAQIALLLGANASARVQLDHALVDHPDELPLIALRARVDAIDRRADLALARIEDAKRSQPEAAASLQPLELELRDMINQMR